LTCFSRGSEDWKWSISKRKAARPAEDAPHLTLYRQQLQLYAYALQKQNGQYPERLWLYWTDEARQERAFMEVPCGRDEIEAVIASVDDLATKIQQRQFAVRTTPPSMICQACDIRSLCRKEGILS